MAEKWVTEHTVYTDFGAYPTPDSVAAVVRAAKCRSDGSLDKRTAEWRFLSRYAVVANKIAAAAYVKKRRPVMPGARVI